MIIECILLSMTLCHAVKDKPVMLLTVASSAAMVGDGITTRQLINRGHWEADPLSQSVLGRYPDWKLMAPIGAAVVISQMYLAERMKHSKTILRHIWWLPQMLTIAGNSTGIVYNLRLK